MKKGKVRKLVRREVRLQLEALFSASIIHAVDRITSTYSRATTDLLTLRAEALRSIEAAAGGKTIEAATRGMVPDGAGGWVDPTPGAGSSS